MKLAYSTNAYRKYPLTEAIERIASLGYGAVEIMADAPHAWPGTIRDDEIDAIRRSLDAAQIEISNINAFMTTKIQDFWHPSWIEPDPDFRRQRVQHTIDSLQFACKLGAPSITTEPGGPLAPKQSREAAMDLFVEGLSEALTCAEKEGVALLVEPEPGLLIQNIREFLQLAERIDSPMFGLNFDIGHFYCVGEPIPQAVDRVKHLTRHYHIEDIADTRVHEHLIPGRGAIDFSAALRAIHATGYEGWITVELYPYLSDPDAAGREAREHLTARMPS